jgi:hypothetical protein
VADEHEVVETSEQVAADAAAFESGFQVARGEPAPKVEEKVEAVEKQPEAVATETTEKKPDEKPAPDPWEGVAPGLRSHLESLTEQFGKFDHRLKSNEGRVGSIHKAMEGLAAAKAAATSAVVADAPAKTQEEAATKYSAALKQIQKDYPDLAEFVEAAREELRAGFPKQQAVDLNGLKTELTTSLSQQLAEAKEEARSARILAAVDRKHDGWEKTIKTPEFRAWQAGAAPDVQALAHSAEPNDAIRMLDLYEEARKKTEATAKAKAANEARLRGAITPKGVPAVAKSTTDEEAFEGGFKAVREGGR